MWPFWTKAACEADAADAAEEVEKVEEEEVAAEEEEPVVEEKAPVELKTAPFDPRFPTTNQAKHCFTRYNEFHKCAKEKDAEDPQCLKYKRFAATICPSDWTTKWDEQRENGTWAGKY